MKRIIIVSLLCIVIVACSNKQESLVTETSYPIEVETLAAISTYFPERIEVLQGIWAYDDGRLQFIRSRVSFVLPKDWDVINITSNFDPANKLDIHIIPRNSVLNVNGKKIIPTIKFVFESVSVGMDSLEYFTNKISIDNLCKINEVFQKGNEILNLDTAIGYKCSYMSEDIQHTLYTIYFTSNFGYETTGIQIIMDSTSDVFSQVDPEFVQFMQSLSITY